MSGIYIEFHWQRQINIFRKLIFLSITPRGVQIEFSCRKIQITCSKIKMLSFAHWSVIAVDWSDRKMIQRGFCVGYLNSPTFEPKLLMSRFMRFWYLSPSVNPIFKRACTAIKWRYVWFFVRLFVYFHTLCLRTAKALARLRGCAVSPEPSSFA